MQRRIADHFQKNVFYGGLTYNSHPIACAEGLATIAIYEEDPTNRECAAHGRSHARHARGSEGAPRVRRSNAKYRSLRDRGVVRNPDSLEPLAPFNGTSPEMQALGKYFRQEGLYTFVRWNTFFTNPPLCIIEDELREAFAIIDKGLEMTDQAVS